MGTALAADGLVIETVKPDAKDLHGQEVGCYRNQKGFWGVISQVAADANAKVRFVQTDWPGETNDVSCFHKISTVASLDAHCCRRGLFAIIC
jgi:hypothetical protein